MFLYICKKILKGNYYIFYISFLKKICSKMKENKLKQSLIKSIDETSDMKA